MCNDRPLLHRRECLLALAGHAVAPAGAALPEKDRPQRRLVLDSRNIERSERARLVPGTARKDSRNPLFREDRPWEARFDNLYANVFYDAKARLFKCWYSPFIVDEAVSLTPRKQRGTTPYKPRKREMGVCYAVSKDGIGWQKPDLGIVEFEGSRKNNLVFRGPHGAGILVDSHDPDPERRYKMFFVEKHMACSVSYDGLHWSDPEGLTEIQAVGDTHNNVLWVPERNAYVGITRLWDRPARQRLVARTESTDFRSWSKAVEIMRGEIDEPHRQTYAMTIFRHAGIYLGMLMIFNTKTDTVDCELAWSPDTVSWERICPGTPLLPLGSPGTYDCGCVYAAATPVVLKEEIRLYYGASNGPHTGWRDGFFCLAHLRPDGFAALEPASSGQTAMIVTKPIPYGGGNLRITADAPAGAVRAGVAGAPDLSVEACSPAVGIVNDRALKWRGRDLGALRGKEVQLVFELRAAKLYSFSLGETADRRDGS